MIDDNDFEIHSLTVKMAAARNAVVIRPTRSTANTSTLVYVKLPKRVRLILLGFLCVWIRSR